MKMIAGWFSMVVLCVAVLRVADSLPLEDSLTSLESSLDSEGTGGVGTPDEGGQDAAAEDPFLSRDKRTIGILRQVFPGLSQIVDRKIQMLTRFLFRFIGRLVLRGGGGGAGGGGSTASSGDSGSRKIQITLPTFPPSEDEEEEEDEDTTGTTTEAESTTTASITTTTEASDAENSVAESKITEVKARARRDTENDQGAQISQGKVNANNDSDNDLDSSSDDNEGEGSEENPRNKRLLKFNLGGGDGSSGGGSGNFLFDIIRLVAGSGTTQEKDEAENAPLEDGGVSVGVAGGVDVGVGKDDGYSAGVPGPLTRLFVIANRGISNLMQDLILRLAQTSERIVNFKARLITSII